MKARGVHLQYSFEADGQRGADVHNPLFDLLSSVHEHGSIQHAAKAMGASYRPIWGALKRWEEVMGEPLGSILRRIPLSERIYDANVLGTGPYVSGLQMARALESEDASAIRKLCETHEMDLE